MAIRRGTRGHNKAQRLVATRVATLGEGTYTDPGQTGLQLRVRAKRNGFSRTWLLRFKFRGEETRIALGHFPETALDSARADARHFRELAAQGIDPRRARPRRRPVRASNSISRPASGAAKHAVDFLVAEFIERHLRPNRRRPEYAERILNQEVLPTWRGRDARTIEPHEVIELLDGVVDRGSRVMANRVASVLGQMFRFGVHRRIVASSPVQLLYRPGGKEKPRERTLADDEIRAYFADPMAAARFERLAHVITLLLLTGQRRGELALARWSEIDFDSGTWNIPDGNAKGGRGHLVPLTSWAVDEFRALKLLAKRSPWVLPANGGAHHADPKLLTRGVARCRKRMLKRGIQAFTLHDLRRTCRTGLAKLGVEPHIGERVLNHAQERIPGTYDRHSYLDEKRAALNKWANHLAGLRLADAT